MTPMPSAALKLFDAVEQSTLLVALFDPSDQLQHANRAYLEAFLPDRAIPVAFADILRHGFDRGIGVRIDCGDVEQFLQEVLPRRRLASQRTLTTDLLDGRWMLFTETLLDDGWLLTVATDISQLKQFERRITQLHASAVQAALTDPLTGVSNRRHILELAAAALRDSALEQVPMSIVWIDLDHFKAINDSHGHHVGDQVLIAFCAQCRAHLRPSDALGRIGGEEFLLVMRGASTAVAAAVMERLREGLRGSGPVPSTFSGGIAEPTPGESLEALLQRADAAMYAAKAAGRGRCVVSVPASPLKPSDAGVPGSVDPTSGGTPGAPAGT
jgi:diguanylate cyclase